MSSIFDVLGPVMVGPSSSHTAGAVRIGYIARKLFGGTPDRVLVQLSGSFAATGKGHGTDKALIAGLLGMATDDLRIPDSFEIAKEEGMRFIIINKDIRGAHPNTARISLEKEGKATLDIEACSIGGGRIKVQKLDGIDVNFTAENNTLIVRNEDKPGNVAQMTTILSQKKINIATMQLYREHRGGIAVNVFETDQPISKQIVEWLEALDGIIRVTALNVKE